VSVLNSTAFDRAVLVVTCSCRCRRSHRATATANCACTEKHGIRFWPGLRESTDAQQRDESRLRCDHGIVADADDHRTGGDSSDVLHHVTFTKWYLITRNYKTMRRRKKSKRPVIINKGLEWWRPARSDLHQENQHGSSQPFSRPWLLNPICPKN